MNRISSQVSLNHFYPNSSSRQPPPFTRLCEATCKVASSNIRLQSGRDLLGYLYARASIGEEIEGDLLERLSNANSIVHNTRMKLARVDIIGESSSFSAETLRRHFYYLHTNLMRDFFPREPGALAIDSAKAQFMGVANCEDMAAHTACNYLRYFLAADECVTVTGALDREHTWGEIHLENAPVVIMDAWSNGPAILKEDARCKDVRTKFHEAYDSTIRDDTLEAMHTATKMLNNNKTQNVRNYKRFWADNHDQLLALPPPRGQESVLSAAFLAKVSGDDNASDLTRHLRAIRILKNLGLTVRDAIRHKEVVQNAFNHRLLNNFRK